MSNLNQAIQQKFEKDLSAYEVFLRGSLNLTAYASIIKEDIDKLTGEDHKEKTIVTALSRLRLTTNGRKGMAVLSGILSSYEIKPEYGYFSVIRNKYTDDAIDRNMKIIMKQKNVSFVSGQNEYGFVGKLVELKIIKECFASRDYSISHDKQSEIMISCYLSSDYSKEVNILSTIFSKFAVNNVPILAVINSGKEIMLLVKREDLANVSKVLANLIA